MSYGGEGDEKDTDEEHCILHPVSVTKLVAHPPGMLNASSGWVS